MKEGEEGRARVGDCSRTGCSACNRWCATDGVVHIEDRHARRRGTFTLVEMERRCKVGYSRKGKREERRQREREKEREREREREREKETER